MTVKTTRTTDLYLLHVLLTKHCIKWEVIESAKLCRYSCSGYWLAIPTRVTVSVHSEFRVQWNAPLILISNYTPVKFHDRLLHGRDADKNLSTHRHIKTRQCTHDYSRGSSRHEKVYAGTRFTVMTHTCRLMRWKTLPGLSSHDA